MKFSMWIVNDWLRDFSPSPRINKGEMNIRGVRYFADGIAPDEGLLYVGRAGDFIPAIKEGVICACAEDLLLLQTEDVYIVFNEIQKMLEYYNEWENSILRSIEEGASITDLLELTLPIIGTTLIVTDASHVPLGIAHHPDEGTRFSYENGRLSVNDIIRVNEILKEYVSVHGPYLADIGHEPKDILRNFYASSGDLIGWFVAQAAAEEHCVNSRMQLTEVFCRLLDFWFRINEKNLLFSPQSALFIDILDGKETDPSFVRFKQEGIGWTGDPEMQLFVLKSQEVNRLDLAFLQPSRSSSFSAFYGFNYQSDVLIIINCSLISEEQFSRMLSPVLKRRKTYCGCSYHFKNLDVLQTYYRQASLAARYGIQKPGTINRIGDFALEYLRHQIGETMDVNISSPALEKLKQYDASAGTEYYQTLKVYLLQERDQTRSAEILCIHRNTLIYRIRKIESIIDTDLDNSRNRFSLLMFFFITDPDFFS